VTLDETREAAQLMLDFAVRKVQQVERRPRRPQGDWARVVGLPVWDWRRNDYRAAPESQYRPYTRAEMIDMVGQLLRRNGDGSTWEVAYLHVGRNHSYCQLQPAPELSMGEHNFSVSSEDLLAGWTHLDGSPCGVEVEV